MDQNALLTLLKASSALLALLKALYALITLNAMLYQSNFLAQKTLLCFLTGWERLTS